MSDILVKIEKLSKSFPLQKGLLQRQTGFVHAVNTIDLDLKRGETLALVGESGCGKSTTAKLLMGAMAPTSGQILLHKEDGTQIDIAASNGRALRDTWRDMQLIFQDPFTSLNPRMSVREIIAEPLRNFKIAYGKDADQRISELLEMVGLKASMMNRYPHAFSGGQRQRIGIARALAVEPKIIIGDEPVSALDVSVAAQILNLFNDLKAELGLTYLLITHDLSIVRHSADRVAVMYLGRIVEENTTKDLFNHPRHPYSKALLSAIPKFGETRRKKTVLAGEIGSARHLPKGCHFHPRCQFASDRCRTELPDLKSYGPSQKIACHFPLEAAS